MVQLARGDSVEAEKTFREWGNCCEPEEVATLQTLLQAFDDEDPELAARMLASPFIRHMDVEYAILSKNIPLPQGIQLEKKTGDNAGIVSTNILLSCIWKILLTLHIIQYNVSRIR